MNINDMKPGPELDRYFAHLIGYQSLTTGLNLDGTYGYTPAYSTTWDGMQQVVEEMQRRGCYIEIVFGIDGVGAHIMREFDTLSHAQAVTAPHAVTVAAIKAIQGEGEQNA